MIPGFIIPLELPGFIVFDDDLLSFQVHSNDLSQVGTYNIIVQASFTGYTDWPDATLNVVLTVSDPCESATLDPNETLEIEKLFGYVDGTATTLQIDAPYDSVGISDGSYFCGTHVFEL